MATLGKQQIKDQFAKARQAQLSGRLGDAERGYKKLLKGAPNLAEVHFNLAEVSVLLGKVAQAASGFEAALKLRPNEPAIWISYLDMASKHPNPQNFELLRKRASPVLKQTPAFAFYEGLAQLRAKSWEKAAQLFKAALSGGFRQPQVFAEYSAALVELKQYALAREQIENGLALAPTNALLLSRKSSLLQSMGELEEARATLQKAIDLSPKAGWHYASYASLTKMAGDDPNIPKMKAALKVRRAGDEDLPNLAYALAKAMEDSGQHSKVFGYLDQANHALAKAYPYDAAAVEAIAERTRKLFDEFGDMAVPTSTAAPIFVTGAPRSGTTLVEQILASHSRVEGGGEMGLIQPKIADLITGQSGDGEMFWAKCAEAVREFEADLARLFPDVPHVTDKSISSYATLGFLAKLMPNARFVVVRRDPRDNALSIYKNQFKAGLHRYANRLDHTAIFLRQFEDMVDLWRDRCPNRFHEIRYEDLIADPEGQSKALVAAAGLEWEDTCLSFYETKREVRTLSATQVRQPMYSSSVGAWKRFERDMQPFLKQYGGVEDG